MCPGIRGADKTPASTQAERFRLAPLGVAVVALFWVSAAILRRADRRGPLGSVAGQAGALAVAMGLIGQAFCFRDAWVARHGSEGAYRHALWRAMAPGMAVFWAAAVHMVTLPGGRRRRWALLPAAYLAGTGIPLVAAAYREIGFRALTLRYLFFPQHGPLVTSGPLAYLRHPGYSGLIRLAMAVALLRGGLRALLTAAVTPVAFAIWTKLVEERELVTRFGGAYENYRRRTHAFFVLAPSRWPAFWRSLRKAVWS